MSCAIGNIEIVGITPKALADYLWDRHHIMVAPIDHEEYQGIRVTPNLYTTLDELDYFCEVFEHASRNGLPKSA
jgi:selenocysteine lyase/cysteine desulfurase